MKGMAWGLLLLVALAGCADPSGAPGATTSSGATATVSSSEGVPGSAATLTATGTSASTATGTQTTAPTEPGSTPAPPPGNESQEEPRLAFVRDDNLDRLVVVAANWTSDWDRLALTASRGGTSFRLNGNATAADTNVGTTGTEVTGVADFMAAGEFVGFCADGAAMVGVSYRVTDTVAGVVVGVYTFQEVAAC